MENTNLASLARDNFDYKDGELYWLKSPARSVKAGTRAGTVNNRGYRRIRIKGKMYQEHRLIYAYHNPDWDESGEIDHINRIRDDNRIENLRVVTSQENKFNANARGYCWYKASQKWWAQIKVDGKMINLGHFVYKTDARLARVTAEKKYHIIEDRA